MKECENPIEFFSEFITCETIRLTNNLPDIEQILSIIVDPQIIHFKIINTMEGQSCEGQKLTGKKVVMELLIKQKILYVSNLPEQSLHIVENDFYQSAYLVIPCKIEGMDVEILHEHKRLDPSITIENISTRKLNNRCIFKSITLLVQLKYIPTYELCYAVHQDYFYSNLFICYENGSHEYKLTSYDHSKVINPQWSPSGCFISFISNHSGKYLLYIFDIKTESIRKLCVPDKIKCITSFCWTPDSKNIIFSGIINSNINKELFFINVDNLKCNQLTNGNSLMKSYKPKSSPKESKIAFLRSIYDKTHLYITDFNGTDFKQVTFLGNIKDFDWSKDGEYITYICNTDDTSYDICIINLNTLETSTIVHYTYLGEKKKICFSPDNKSIAFIGSDYLTEDIFIYDLQKKAVTNITNNECNTKISDFAWKIDSSKIYYSKCLFNHCNICSVVLDTQNKYELTNSTASYIELNYRPKVV
ncbi:hypothetical protein OW763_02230 [Clostridium aestuarii]|uniref:Translation initiation factor beta propellor-like domain-containing protein n=1 Tax=Clostridium aestuarii TaxID=338193 RepID=A0ABT4CXT3_9CLOT|nr:hypothetical protein [Clostridium aestuarii]MCY6483172.1 hypothetical protein [Clostridium aestuarii]